MTSLFLDCNFKSEFTFNYQLRKPCLLFGAKDSKIYKVKIRLILYRRSNSTSYIFIIFKDSLMIKLPNIEEPDSH